MNRGSGRDLVGQEILLMRTNWYSSRARPQHGDVATGSSLNATLSVQHGTRKYHVATIHATQFPLGIRSSTSIANGARAGDPNVSCPIPASFSRHVGEDAECCILDGSNYRSDSMYSSIRENPSLRRLIELEFPTPSPVQITVPVTVELASMQRPPSPGNSTFVTHLAAPFIFQKRYLVYIACTSRVGSPSPE